MKISDPIKSLQNFAEAYDINVEERKSTLNEIAEEIDAHDTYKQARTLKAVADSTRLKIIMALSHHELCVCELMLLLNAQQSAVSHHPVSYTHLRAHETDSYLVCRLLLEKKKKEYYS